VTIQNWSYLGPAGGTNSFVSIDYCYNVVIQNNHIDNSGYGVVGGSILNYNVTIQNNYIRSSTGNSGTQTDIIHMGDTNGMLIQGNMLIDRAISSTSPGHQDVIQTYMKGGSDAANPTNWIVRYNWIEMDDVIGGSGDNSWMMIESFKGQFQIYGNVFYGNPSATKGTNGIHFGTQDPSCIVYFYNNTIIGNSVPVSYLTFFYAPGELYSENNIIYEMVSRSSNSQMNSWTMADMGWKFNYLYNVPGAGASLSGPNGSTTINPQLKNPSALDFSLSATSPLIHAGDSSIGAKYNMGIAPGATWPNPVLNIRLPGAWDIGAYQWQ
jgi:hypothetical protein